MNYTIRRANINDSIKLNELLTKVNVCNNNKEAISTYKNNGFNEIKAITMKCSL